MIATEFKYKKTGIDWIPEVPEHWKLWKVSRAFNIIGSGTTPESGNLNYYNNGTINWVVTGDLNDNVLETCEHKITKAAFEKHSALKLFPKGTLLVAMYGATIGKTGILGFDACTNQACCALGDSNVLLTKFVYYWFFVNRRNIVRLSYGGGQPNISKDVIKQLRIQTPPIEEQEQIVSFLDAQSAKIMRFIQAKQRFIELLKEQRQSIITQAVTQGIDDGVKMKETGMNWMPRVPEHWDIRRLKYLVELYKHNKSVANLLEFNFKLALENIDNWTGKYIESVSPEFDGEGRCFKLGDVLFGKLRPYLAKAFLPETNGICVSEILVFTPNSGLITSEFLFQRILTKGFIDIVDGSTYGAKMPRASWDFIGNMRIAFPPTIEEQSRIVAHIKTETYTLDVAINKAEREIDLIKEYREAMIAELVTGKIKL